MKRPLQIPIVVAARRFRLFSIVVGVPLYVLWRLSHPSGASLLQILASIWMDMHHRCASWAAFLLLSDNIRAKHMHTLCLSLLQITTTIAQDVVAIGGMIGLARFCYNVFHFRTKWTTWKDCTSRRISRWIVYSHPFPLIGAKVREISDEILNEADSMLKKNPNRIIRTTLPGDGLSREVVLEELTHCADRENARVNSGRVSGTLYASGREHSELMTKVYGLYQWSNPLKPGVWPRVNQCEAEIVSMTANIFHAGPSSHSLGSVTSGGTESILNAVRAHLEVYGRRRGISHPEIICGSTAHCSLNKACEMLNIHLVCIDCDDGCSYELKADVVQRHITSNTIMMFSSAPSFPQGTIDPIEDLSELATRHGVGLHVDACLGGFVLPFCSEDVLPRIFDFRLEGVTTMSADPHKFGQATKGTSVVLFRTMELQHASYFPCSNWSGGLYITPTMAGSRPGALIACAWSAMVSIGEAGYRRRAKSIVDAARRIAGEIASIKGIKLMTTDPTIVVCFGSDEFNIYKVKDSLSRMGWSLNPLQSPPSINICVTENLVMVLDEFLSDLRSAVDEAKDEVSMQKKTKGTEAIYETAKMLPSGPVEYAMCKFIDATLVP